MEVPIWLFVILCVLASPFTFVLLFFILALVCGVIWTIVVKLIDGIKYFLGKIRGEEV